MIRLFNFQTLDTMFFYIFVLIVIIGTGFYIYKFRKNLITKRNIEILLGFCVVSIVTIIVVDFIKDNPEGDIYYTKFKDAGTLKVGSKVIYRGVHVGKVMDISITPDSRYALVKFMVTDINAKIPKNSRTKLAFGSLTDRQPLFIDPPDHEKEYQFLANNEYLKSNESEAFEAIELLISRLIQEGKVEKMVDNVSDLVQNTSDITKNLEYTLKETSELVKSVKSTNDNINKIIQDKEIQGDIKTTVKNANSTFKTLQNVANKTENVIDQSGEVIQTIQATVKNADKNLNNDELHTNLLESSRTLKGVLSDIEEISGDETVHAHVRHSLEKSSQFTSNINCLTQGMGKILNKRFLVPRMVLGKTGSEIQECNHKTLLEMQQIQEEVEKQKKDDKKQHKK